MTHDFGSRTGLPVPATVAELMDRLEDAALTLRRVPGVKHSQPARELRSNWPDYVRDAREAYGYYVARGGAIKASAADIARMDEVLAWIARWWSSAEMRRARLPEDGGAVAWLRIGAGWQMRRLQKWRQERYGMKRPPGGNSRESLRLVAQRAMEHMVAGLTQAPVTPQPIEADAPQIAWDVVVDDTVESRVSAILGDGQVLVRTRHARAEHREVPARAWKKGED
jgi:hypothetical protein